MSIKNFLDRLRKRISDRRALVQPRSTGKLRVTRLEERKLLDAGFSVLAGAITLDNFSLNDTLTIDGDLSAGTGSFTLLNGTWDPTNLLLVSGEFSLAGKTLSQATTGPISTLNIDASVAATAAEGALAGVTSSAIGLQVANLNVTDGGNINLSGGLDDFDTVSVDGDHSASLNLVDADGGIEFKGLKLSGDADIDAGSGNITDSATAVIDVTGNVDFHTTGSVTLGEQATDSTNFGSLSFTSAGQVEISEDSATQLTGANSADVLNLASAGDLTDSSGSLNVTGHANLTADSILLGDAAGDSVQFGSLEFHSTGDVGISETGDLSLSGDSSGNNVELVSAGSLGISATLSAAGFVDLDAVDTVSLTGAIEADGLVAIDAGNQVDLDGDISGSVAAAADSVTVGGTTAPNLVTIDGGILANSGIAISGAGNIILGATALLNSDANSDLTGNVAVTVAGAFTQTAGSDITGTGGLTKAGSGSLVLSQANTYTGGTTVNAGTLQVSTGGSVASSFVLAGGTLDVDGQITGNVTLNAGTMTGVGTVTGNVVNNATIAPGNSPGVLTINGNYSGTGVLTFEVNPPAAAAGMDYDQLVVNGALDLSGTSLTFSGTSGTVSDNLLLTLIANDGSGTTAAAISHAEASAVIINGNSYTLFYASGDGNDVVLVEASTPATAYVDDDSWSTLSAGTVIADADYGTAGDQSAIFGVNAFSTISAAEAAVMANGTIIVNDGTYNETVSLSGTKTLEITGPDAAAAVVIADLAAVAGTSIVVEGASSLTFGDANNREVAAVISGSGTLVKVGSGTVTFSGANAFDNTLTIDAGTIAAGHTAALGAIAGGTIVNGGTLDLNGFAIGFEALTINGNGASGVGSISNSSGTAAALAGEITLAGDASLGGSGDISFSGGVDGTTADTESLTLVGAGSRTFTGILGGGISLRGLFQDNAAGEIRFHEDVTLGAGGATFNANVTLDGMTLTADGDVIFGNAAGDVLVISGATTAVITNADGITLTSVTTGNQHLTLNSAAGISVNNTVTMAAGMDLTANAVGTIDLANSNADISATGNGEISLTAERNIVLASGSSVTTVDGNLLLSANQQAISTSGNFIGINVNGGLVQAAGTGTVTVLGKGGDDAAGYQSGVRISGDIIGGTTGLVTVTGQGGSLTGTGNANVGVLVSGSGGSITSAGGNVQVTGTGGGAGSSTLNHGVDVSFGGLVSAGGSGMVVVAGTGGSVGGTAPNNYGVFVYQTNSVITSSGGAVSVTGIGGGSSGGNSIGVAVGIGGTITSGTNAAVTVIGTGGNGGGNGNGGVVLYGNVSKITSGGGDVQVTGITGGSGVSAGIALQHTSSITTATNGGTITLATDSLRIDATASVAASASSSVTIRQYTNGANIDLGGVDSAGTLGVSDNELNTITAGTVMIGDTNSGDINVSSTINVADNTTPIPVLKLVTGAAITGSGSLTVNSLMLEAVNGIGSTASPLNTVVDKLTAVNSTGGAIAISNAGSLTLGSVGSGITNSAVGGAIEISVVAAGNDLVIAESVNGSGTIELTAADELRFEQATGTTGVQTSGAGVLGVVTLSAGTAVVGNSNIATDVNAASLNITAASGIGSANAVETIVSNLDITNSTGNVLFEDTKATGIAFSGSGGTGLVALTETAGAITIDDALSGGSLVLNAAGQITDGATGTLTIDGTTSLTAGAGNDIILDNANDFGGDVTVVSGKDVTLNDISDLQFGGTSVISGHLVATTDGTITDGASATLAVSGTTSLAAGSANDITLDNANNFVGDVTIVSGKDVTLNDINDLQFGGTSVISQALVVTTSGTITDGGAGTLAVTGTTSLTAGSTNNITLDNSNNFVGDVTIVSGNHVTLNDVNALQFGGTSVVGGDLVATTVGTITDGASGTLAITGTTSLTAGATHDITLDNANDFAGDITVVSGKDVTLNDINAVQFAGLSTISNNLLVSASGIITDGTDGDLAITGHADFTGSAITLGDDAGNATNFGSLTFNSAGAVSVTEDSATELVNANTGNSLTLTSFGDVTLTGTTTVDATTAAFTSNTGSIDGSGLITAATVGLNAATGIGLGSSTAIQTAASSISADTAVGNIDIDNVLVTATTVTSLTTGNGGIKFDQTGGGDVTFSGPVTSGDTFVNGGAIMLTAADGLTIDGTVSSDSGLGGTLSITGATVNGMVKVGAGSVSIQGGDVDLTIAAAINSGSDIILNAERDVIISNTVTAGGGAKIIVTADTNSGTDAGSGPTGGHGGVHVTAAGQLYLGGGPLDIGGSVAVRGSDIFATAGAVDSVRIDANGTSDQVLSNGAIIIGDSGNAPSGAATIINGLIRNTLSLSTIQISAAGNVELGSFGDVLAVDGAITITADNEAGNHGGQVIMANGAQVSASTATITVEADGNVSIGQLSTANTVSVKSISGAITDAGDDHMDIIAVNTSLSALTGIGDDADALETRTSAAAVTHTIAAETDSGDIHIVNTGSLTVGTVGSLSGITITDNSGIGSDVQDSTLDNITLSAASPLTVNSAITNNDGSGISLTSTNDGGSDDHLTINAALTITGGDASEDATGNVDLNAGTNLVINANIRTDAAGAITGVAVGNVQVLATSELTTVDGNQQLTATNGSVTLADGTSLQSTTGDISISAATDVGLSALTTGVGGIRVAAAAGSITDNTVAESANLTNTGMVTLSAATGIGATGSADINTDIAFVQAMNSTSGDIVIHEFDELSIAGTGVSTTGGNGNIRVDVDAGNLVVNSAAVITANGSGDVTLNVDDGMLTQNAAVSSGTGDIDVYANAVAQNSTISTASTGRISVTADSGDITMADGTSTVSVLGAIGYGATGNVRLASVSSTSGNITITADSDSSAAGSVIDNSAAETANIATSGFVSLTAATGIGAAGTADINTEIGSLQATNTTSGNVVVNEANDLVIAGTGVRTLAGNGSIDLNTGGSLTADSVITAHGAGDLNVNSDGTLTTNAVVSSSTGDLELVATSVVQNANITTGATGTVVLNSLAGDIFMASGTVTGADEILYTGRNVALSQLVATSSVQVTSSAAITDNLAGDGTGFENIVTEVANLKSQNGIGASGTAAIDTAVTTLMATDNGAGSIFINETDGVLLTASTTDGSINMQAAGLIDAISVSAGGATGDSIYLSTTSGGITATSVVAADSVTLSADAGDILATSLTAYSGSVNVDAAVGDVLIDLVTADILATPGIAVDIYASGSIIDNNGAALNIQASSGVTRLEAGLDIGFASSDVFKPTPADPLEVRSAEIEIVAARNVAVHETGSGKVTILTADSAFLTSANDLDLSGGTITTANLSLLATGTLTLPSSATPLSVSGDLRIEAADVAAGGTGVIDVNAMRLLFKSGQGETLNLTVQEFDGEASGDLAINNDSAALELVDLDCDLTAIDVGSGVATISQTASAVVSQRLPSTPQTNSKILAGSLVLNGSGTFELTNAYNNVAVLAGNNTGAVTYKDLDAISIDAVGSVHGLTSGNNDVLLDVGTTLTISQTLNAGTGNVRILSKGAISQVAAGTITADLLGIRNEAATGDIVLDDANDVNTVAIQNTAVGGVVAFENVDDFIIGTVTAQTLDQANFAETSGIHTSNGDVVVNSGGTLDINQQVNSGTADTRIMANGNVQQTGDGTFVADELAVLQLSPGANVLLDDNNFINTIAVSNVGGGKVAINSAGDLIVGTVAPTTIGNIAVGVVSGVSTTNADVFIYVQATHSLTLNSAINSGTGYTYLQAGNDITQSAAGTITAAELGIYQFGSSGDIVLDDGNDVDVLATSNAADSGQTVYRDIDDLTIDSVAAATCGNITFAGIDGIQGALLGDALLDVNGSLTINQQIDFVNGDVRILADDDVVQSALGIIAANELAIRQESVTAGDVLLDDGNRVDVVSIINDRTAGTIGFNNEIALAVDSVSSQTIGNITFAQTDGVKSADGDVLINSEDSLTLRQQVNAAAADVRLVADGTISQTTSGFITAASLGVRQESAAGDVLLGAAPNDVDVYSAINLADGSLPSGLGAITFFDADELLIDQVGSQTIGKLVFTASTGIDTNAGDINITSEGDLTVIQNVNAAHNVLTTSIDETISLISRGGNFTLADNIIITSDEDPTAGVFDDVTGDKLTIIAGSSGINGTVTLGENVEVRTDGGVAKQIAPRPTAFAAAATTGAETAFVTLTDAENMRSSLTFVDGKFLGTIELVFGVGGEENLEVVIDWGVVSQTSLNPAGPAGDATAVVGSPDTYEFDVTDADKTIYYIDAGGSIYQVPHLFAIADLVTTVHDRNGREINPNIIGVRFSVAQHESINIWGNSATVPGTATVETPPDFTSSVPVATVFDAAGQPIVLPDAGLALLSSTDTNPLQSFNQEAAQLPMDNTVVTPTGRPVGEAEWEFIAGPSPGILPFVSSGRPANDTPFVEAPVASSIVSSVVTDINLGSGAASDAAIGTDVYLQIRRHFELDAEAEVVIPRITDNSFISNRESFEQFVRENPVLQDGSGYEVWLITETSGQQVERPIVKFEVTGGRPGPATEQLPGLFEPYELKELEYQQPDENGNAIPDPPQETSAVIPAETEPLIIAESREALPPAEQVTASSSESTAQQSSAAGAEDHNDSDSTFTIRETSEHDETPPATAVLLAPVVGLTTAARWRRRQDLSAISLSSAARTVRRLRQAHHESSPQEVNPGISCSAVDSTQQVR